MRFAGTLHQSDLQRESVDAAEPSRLTTVDRRNGSWAMSVAWFRPFQPFEKRCDPIGPAPQESGSAPDRIPSRAPVVNDAPIGETMIDLEEATSPDQERRVRNHEKARTQNSAIPQDVKAACVGWIANLDTGGGNDSTNVISLIVGRPLARRVVDALRSWRFNDKDRPSQLVVFGIVDAMTSRLLPNAMPRSHS